MVSVSKSSSPRALLLTACSALFYDHYIDLLDSIAAVGTATPFDTGLIDLGVTGDQRAELIERGVRIVPARWPIEPPAEQNQLHMVAYSAKPFARDYFPGYDVYVWMDADMWVQTPQFWSHLVDGAMRTGMAVPLETDSGYRRMEMSVRLWMLRHCASSWGLRRTRQIMSVPMVNNGLFAIRGDAPQWDFLQARYRIMVSKTQRSLAIDQLATLAMMALDKPDLALLDAANNWVCSLGTPMWDASRNLFVKPDGAHDVIHVMHITTPARLRRFAVQATAGGVTQRYLHRPGGRVLADLMAGDEAAVMNAGAGTARSPALTR